MALQSQGVQLFWSTSTAASTAAGALVGQVNGINGPDGSASEIDVTNLGSTAHEFLMGLKNEGSVSLSVFTDTTDAAQLALWADRSSRTMRKAVIKFNDSTAGPFNGSRLVFDAFCIGYTYAFATDDAVKSDITLKITGAATYTASTVAL